MGIRTEWAGWFEQKGKECTFVLRNGKTKQGIIKEKGRSSEGVEFYKIEVKGINYYIELANVTVSIAAK